MSLSRNPQLFNRFSIGAPQGTTDQPTSGIGSASSSSKFAIDQLVDRQSGGITDGRNSTTGGIAGGIAGAASSAFGSVKGAAAGLKDKVSGLTGGSLASGINSLQAKAAGQVDNLLSKVRGQNLPLNGEQFATIGSEIQLDATSADDWRVKINTNWSLFEDNDLFVRLEETGGVVFPFLPEIMFSTSANYSKVEPPHTNYAIPFYQNSVVNDITISGEFTAETELDAEYWIAATNFFKSATKMFSGQSANAGNPPVICTLSGYGTSIFANTPVVITGFEMQLPKDVNYIKYESVNWDAGSFDAATWVPVLSTLSITVTPIYNRERLRKFSLQDYARGGLVTPDSKQIGYL